MTKVLFICKQRINSYGNTFGLFNSARMVSETLNSLGIEAKVISVVDNNCIDREVVKYNPTHVIIEAIWVVASKLRLLLSLPRHQNRMWYVRLHSRIPFLAMEGIAFDWLQSYKELIQEFERFNVSANTRDTCDDLRKTIDIPSIYQPNIYRMEHDSLFDVFKSGFRRLTPVLNIGCFGAIRPLKNHLMQAVAAIDFANQIGKPLRFHINTGRLEQRGEEVFKNLKSLFRNSTHELVEHPWMSNDDFRYTISQMNVGMQVSYSETFNIVAADFVSQNVPIVVSDEMYWMSNLFKVDPNSRTSMVHGLKRAYYGQRFSLQTLNYLSLRRYNRAATKAWLREGLAIPRVDAW